VTRSGDRKMDQGKENPFNGPHTLTLEKAEKKKLRKKKNEGGPRSEIGIEPPNGVTPQGGTFRCNMFRERKGSLSLVGRRNMT